MRIAFIIGLTLILNYAIGQNNFPPVCIPPAKMESTCADACIICDIDGFTGRNNSTIQGEEPAGFCTSFAHHMQWIGFVAATTNLKVSVTVSNCARNNGLEVGFYKGIDCKNYEQITFCDTDIRPGETATFTNTKPLEIGQYYYIVMDGSDNDICDWTFKVLEGSTKLSDLKDKAAIVAPDMVCESEKFEISTVGVTGGTDYLWRIDGDIINSGKKVEHVISTAGTYNICVTPRNVCQLGVENCKKITVLPISRSAVNVDICENECYTWYSTVHCTSGAYPVSLSNVNGCDSIVTLNLNVKKVINEERSLSLCKGDTLSIEKYKLFSSGTYPLSLINADGCEITLTVNLSIVDCSIKMDANGDSLRCNNDGSGMLTFMATNGVPPLTYEIYKIENESITFSGSLAQINQTITLSGLSAGNYAGVIKDNFGRESFFYQSIEQPKKLKLDYVTSDYNGVNIKCNGDQNGSITLMPTGGTGFIEMTYKGQTIAQNILSSLSAGAHMIEYVDRNQCGAVDTIILVEPKPITPSYQIIDADCAGPLTGAIIYGNSLGGTGAIIMTANGERVTPKINNLGRGFYTLLFTDINGCTREIIDTLYDADIPNVSTDSTMVNVNLGDSLYLFVNDTINNALYQWSSISTFSCNTCLNTSTQPLSNGTIRLVATSKDGCKDSLFIEVRVTKKRSFVLSNIMVYSSATGNKDLRYYAGKDVKAIDKLEIYDRWGSKVYNGKNLVPGAQDLNWKGNYSGLEVNTGVYTWIAQVTYLDNVVIVHKGSLNVVD